MKIVLAVLLSQAPAGAPRPPEAATRDEAAMQRFERGDLEGAYAEFVAAYAALPDAAGDRAAREGVMGSLRSVLRALHARAPRDPGALCRLERHLHAHVEALRAAYPAQPDLLELVGNEVRLAEVRRELAPFGDDACASAAEKISPDDAAPRSAEPPSPTVSASPPTRRAAEVPPARPADVIPPRHLKIAGGVTLGLAAAALGVMTWGIRAELGLRDEIDDVESAASGRPFTNDERDALMDLLGQARSSRHLALGTGIAGAGLAAIGAALVVAGHRAARTSRWSASPWWLPAGGGLVVHARLGATSRARRAPRRGAP